MADKLTRLIDSIQAIPPSYVRGPWPSIFDPAIPPGGYVCAACGMPTESEPCADHQEG